MSEGSVYRRKDGRFCAKWKDVNGKWKYAYRKTRAEAKQALRQALKDREDGIVPVGKMTLNDLLDSWFEDMEGTVSLEPLRIDSVRPQGPHTACDWLTEAYSTSLTRTAQGSTDKRYLRGS